MLRCVANDMNSWEIFPYLLIDQYICNELGVIWSISHKILKIITRSCIIIQTTNPVSAGNVIYVLHNYIYGLRAS